MQMESATRANSFFIIPPFIFVLRAAYVFPVELSPQGKFRKTTHQRLFFHTLGKGKAAAKAAVDMVVLKRLYFGELRLGAVRRL